MGKDISANRGLEPLSPSFFWNREYARISSQIAEPDFFRSGYLELGMGKDIRANRRARFFPFGLFRIRNWQGYPRKSRT